MTTAVGSYVTTALLKQRANIGDTNDDTMLGLICDQINQYVETTTKRVLAPITSATYLYDGDGTCELYLPRPPEHQPIGGVRAVTLVEVAGYTNGPYVTLSSVDYFLRRRVLMTDMYEQLVLSDRPTSGYGYFPVGRNTVRVTQTAGCTMPDDVQEIAAVTAVKAWHALENGETNIVGSDEMGKPLVNPDFLKARLYGTLMNYAIGDVLVSG